jgi:hypothetical protein
MMLGLAVLATSLLADRIGIGAVPGVLGWKQLVGAGVGLALLVGGALLARRAAKQG